jgi:hypothetical protein
MFIINVLLLQMRNLQPKETVEFVVVTQIVSNELGLELGQ